MDPEGLLLELAVTRSVIDRATAEAIRARRAEAPVPVLLARVANVSEPVLARLKAEVTAYLQRSYGGGAPVSSGSRAALPPSSGSGPPIIPVPSTSSGSRSSTSNGPGVASTAATFRMPGPSPSSSGSGARAGLPPAQPAPFAPDSPTLAGGIMVQGRGETVRDSAVNVGPAESPTVRSTPPQRREPKRPQAGDRFGRYALLSELGRGGMGIVFRARHEDLGREVALKMLLEAASSSEATVRRFFAEARSVAKLSHPHIVTVHDVGSHEGVHYFTMDFVEGRGLHDLIAKGEIPRDRALSLAIKLARALAYAHGEGVIHRDLKPANVLIDKKGEPRITDFGIAKDLSATQATQAGEFLGTPAYMPPEQAKGRALDADPRSDVYSLGAVLFEMLTHRPPFVAETAFKTMNLVVNEAPPRPRSLVPEIAPDLEAIVLKCLEKDPANRYPTADALAQDLDKFAQSESVDAPRAPAIASSDVKRALAGASIGLLVLAIVFGGAFAWAVHARKLAEEEEARVARAEAEAEAARAAAKAKAEEEQKARAREKARALVQDALAAAGRDDAEAAVSLAAEAAAASPGLVLAHETLARFYVELRRDPDRALAAAEKALSLDPRSVEGRAQHARALALSDRPADALSDADKLEALGPEGEAWSSRVRGEVAILRKDFAGAIPHLGKAAERAPRDAAVRITLARACLEARRFADAERAATEVCQLEPERAQGFLLRARARVGQGKLAPALDDARVARRIAPDDAEAKALLARLEGASSSGSGEQDEGHKALHRAAAAATSGLNRGDRGPADEWLARPRDPGECVGLVVERANVLWRLNRLADAEAEFGRAHELAPQEVAFLGNRGLVRKALGKNEEALADFDAALATGCPPGMLPAAIGQAQILDKLDRVQLADQAWDRAIAASPDARSKGNAHHERAHGLFHRERYAEAEREMDTAIELDSSQGHYFAFRGEARLKRGDPKAAAEDFRVALTKPIAPDEANRVRASLAGVEGGGKKAPP